MTTMAIASSSTFLLSFTPKAIHHFTASHPTTKLTYPPTCFSPQPQILRSPMRKHHLLLSGCCKATISRREQGTYDPELRYVLELATDSELYELEHILFGPSYFSPLLKSITNRADVDYMMIGEDFEEREHFIELLETRFLYLAADARCTLRGWRPSYREILLGVRKKLSIPCSSKLSTEDLEVEIFLHLLQDCSSGEADNVPYTWGSSNVSSTHDSSQFGLSQWKMQALSALKVGAGELKSMILKGGGMLTLANIYKLIAGRLSGKMLLEAANYQMKNEIIREGGKLAAINLESRVALLAAKKGLAGAASRYLGLRSMMMLLGPMLWGTLLADVVIQMLGTDYARILRAIYAFAQIRVTRTYRWASDKNKLCAIYEVKKHASK